MTFCVVPEVNASLILQINTFSLVFNFRFTILAPLSTLPFAPQKAHCCRDKGCGKNASCYCVGCSNVKQKIIAALQSILNCDWLSCSHYHISLAAK